MKTISATARLRPTRIGFLVRPNNMAAVVEIMRACTCVWGGVYNPIIPVFRSPPTPWRTKGFERVKGLGVAKGYIEFYEPDVFVEAEVGLAEECGLAALREDYVDPMVITLKEFLALQHPRDWSEPSFSLPIVDVYRHLYETEHRFQSARARRTISVGREASNGLAAALFGAFPLQPEADYIKTMYLDVFRAEDCDPTADVWLQVYRDRAYTPLQVTKHGLQVERYWHHDLVVFVFDPERSIDLIDLWNLRLEPEPVVPVPLDWLPALADHIKAILVTQHRPVQGNEHGVMHRPTVEFARSVTKELRKELTALLRDLPPGVLCVKDWRTRVWERQREDEPTRQRRLLVTAEDQHVGVDIEQDAQRMTGTFQALTPKFAARFGGGHYRWVNTLRFSHFGAENVARVLPFNTFNRTWPQIPTLGNERISIGTEGWVFGQTHTNWNVGITPLTMDEAIIGSLKQRGVEARLSDPGHVAKQMLEQLGGLWGTHLLADLETLQLLNKMAGGLRRRKNDADLVEETFALRTAGVKLWTDLVSRRNTRRALPKLELSDFTERNVIKVGLETNCYHCQATNWHSLTTVDYMITCERCLKLYAFPQAALKSNSQNWHYRVVGPFSVPDYGRGAYASLLTLRALQRLGSSTDQMTFSTALSLRFDGIDAEADFLAWRRHDHFDYDAEPQLIIGETKSLGQDRLFKAKDIAKLRAVARKLPGAFLVIAVLRENFTDAEKASLRPLVLWGRRPDARGCATNSVILLTAHELFCDFRITSAWKGLGEPYSSLVGYEHTNSLHRFADATQRIHLGMTPYFEWSRARWKARAARRRGPPRNVS